MWDRTDRNGSFDICNITQLFELLSLYAKNHILLYYEKIYFTDVSALSIILKAKN